MGLTVIRYSCAKKAVFCLPLLAAGLQAQQVGPVRGAEVGTYNVVNSFETGYRFSDVDGSLGKYRSDVNYRNGIRLLGSNLSVHSRDGHGRFFDEILLYTLGLGNDPYQSSTLRIQKNRLYRYDMLWRLNEYFNPALRIADGQHFQDTRRRLQDHDLTLLPQSSFKLRLGYSRNNQTGPALSTVQQFNVRGDEFPLFADVRRERNEYRVGGDMEAFKTKLTWLHRWEYFKDDSTQFLTGPALGNNPLDATVLDRFHRAQPYHGSTPAWLVNLRTERRSWAANGRFTYSGGRRDFIFDESTFGTDRSGLAATRQLLVQGNARRPVTTGDFALSFFPAERITVVNNTSVHSTRIDGDASYRELNLGTLTSDLVFFRFLGMRAITNSTDIHFRVSPVIGLYSGYHFSTRRVRSIENFGGAFGGGGESAEQDNVTHSGLFGVRFKPLKPLTVNVDAEIARADRPFFPISDRNYHALSGRIQYKAGSLLLSALYKQNYNTNSVSISTHSSRARNYSLDASWAPRGALALDAGYSKLHLNTLSGIAFFAGSPRVEFVQGRQSLYFSNIHAGNLGVRLGLGRLADLNLGYTITKDTGDSRRGLNDPIGLVLAAAQTFPLVFHSPQARLSLRLHTKLRWNFAWQFYRYREDFFTFQNYRANTGYTSLLWSF